MTIEMHAQTGEYIIASKTIRDQSAIDTQNMSVSDEPVSIDQGIRADQSRSVDGTHSLPGHSSPDPQLSFARENSSVQTTSLATPMVHASELDSLDDNHQVPESQWITVAVNSSPSAMYATQPTQQSLAGNPLHNGYLCLLSDMLDDLEGVRLASASRALMLTRTEVDSDGVMRGLGMNALEPQVMRALLLVDGITTLEKSVALDLKRALRRHPLYPFVKNTIGIGEKQGARLLAVIGDPYWNDRDQRPRTVSELWAYCGYSVTLGHAQRRTKGVKSNWNDKAKSRTFLIAEACMKQRRSPYRKVYDDARMKYTNAVHPHDCSRCGPKGSPALAGSSLSDGHQHQRALRLVSKAILKDLWLQARQIHTGEVVN